jgi:hypothetical protein
MCSCRCCVRCGVPAVAAWCARVYVVFCLCVGVKNCCCATPAWSSPAIVVLFQLCQTTCVPVSVLIGYLGLRVTCGSVLCACPLPRCVRPLLCDVRVHVVPCCVYGDIHLGRMRTSKKPNSQEYCLIPDFFVPRNHLSCWSRNLIDI